MAEIIKEITEESSGNESGLSLMARAFLVFGIVSVIACIGVMCVNFNFGWLILGVVCLLFGVVSFIHFNALADMIRLLKRQAGIPYSGRISGTGTITTYRCSVCSNPVWEDSEKCENCGSEFVPATEVTKKDTTL